MQDSYTEDSVPEELESELYRIKQESYQAGYEAGYQDALNERPFG